MAPTITPLPHAGAEVTGTDLANLSDEDFAAVRAAFVDHGLLFIRGQELTEADHIAFAERWGDININRFFTAHDRHPQIAMVVKEPDQTGNIGEVWHTDHSYDVEPALGSILVARELPNSGGDTHFASMYAAFDALDDEMKAFVRSHSARHSARHAFGAAAFYRDGDEDQFEGRYSNSDVADAMPDVVHPMVIEHPLSGRPALYVNPTFTVGIDGMEDAEARPILKQLYRHAMQPQFVQVLQWQPGTVAFWDNRAVWHSAQNDYHGQRRIMHRITIEGCALSRAA
jgi:taurine dioxygenase